MSIIYPHHCTHFPYARRLRRRSGVRTCGPTIPASIGRRSWTAAPFWCGTACGQGGAMAMDG